MTRTKPAPEPSMAERCRQRVRSLLGDYRAYVARHVDGKKLTGDELDRVAVLLGELRLPGHAWERDCNGLRHYRRLAEREAELAAAEPVNAAKARELRDEIAELEKRLVALRGEQHRLANVEPLNRVSVLRRQNELKSLHPHLLLNIDAAVGLRQGDMEKGGQGV